MGATSIAAMLADALSLMGESVLLIDLNPSDLLRLYFNIPYADKQGWALAEANGSGWERQTYQVKDNFYVLPYGRHGLTALGVHMDTPISAPALWLNEKLSAATGCSWVIFDAADTRGQHARLHQSSDLHLLVTHADMASHILLGQHHLAEKTKIVVNQLDVKQRLSDTVLLDWNIRYAKHLVPISVRQDLHVQEAFAHKMPATSYFPDSSSAQDVLSLATWCLVQRGAA
ncbi:cellulose synthase operon protein YhjQ/BcsQ [Pseudomonas sp. C27(2019)]|uniref:cellulose synthase operon protein YhjQ/BcsQ n=1 Tax=Pseudomonas sp. C27(2019) TaxID=2604941 RepID=UPI0015B3AB42|nr:cellulose synthase operon protein YhjQ/BcsQ [Pseudomonas sp. C27(2019)]